MDRRAGTLSLFLATAVETKTLQAAAPTRRGRQNIQMHLAGFKSHFNFHTNLPPKYIFPFSPNAKNLVEIAKILTVKLKFKFLLLSSRQDFKES